MTMMLGVWSLNVVFLYTANFINVFVCIAIGEEEAIFLLVRVRRVKFFFPIHRGDFTNVVILRANTHAVTNTVKLL